MAQLNAIYGPTEQQVLQAQQQATRRAEQLASDIEGINGPDQALVREVLPNEDLESGDDNGWNGTHHEWAQDGLSADQDNHVYVINSNGAAQNKVLVFYGVANPASSPATTEVTFKDGTGATFARFAVEHLNTVEISDYVIFDEPITYGSTEDGDIDQWSDTATGDEVIYLAKVAEPLGETLTTRDRPSDRLRPTA